MTYTVYALQDPETGRVRYIGHTRHPHRRLRGHINAKRTRRVHNEGLMAWLEALRASGKHPVMVCLREGLETFRDALDAEREEIAKHKALVPDILNIDQVIPVSQRRKSRKGMPNVYWEARRLALPTRLPA